MSAVTTIASRVVQDLGWADPYHENPLEFDGKVLASSTGWLVLIGQPTLSAAQAQAALEHWFTILKSKIKPKPSRIDVVFCLDEAPDPKSIKLKRLAKQTFLSAEVRVSYLVPGQENKKTLGVPAELRKALLAGIEDFEQGRTVDEDSYSKAVEASVGEHRELKARLDEVQPHGTYTILGCCLAMFAWATFAGGTEDLFTLLRFGANYSPLVKQGEWWRLVGAMFMHIGWVHLLVNMYSLMAVGILLEQVYGNVKYLAMYALAGLGGSLASAFLGSGAVSAGASGALFGLFGATALVGYRYRSEFPPHFSKALSQGMLPAILYNLLYGFSSSGIDNAAHIGGLVTGVLFAAVIRPDVLEEEPNKAMLASLALLALMPFLVQGYVAYRAHAYPTLKTFPQRVISDVKGEVEISIPALFTKKQENGETYWLGPGMVLALSSLDDGDSLSVEEAALQDELRRSEGSQKVETVMVDDRIWLLEDGIEKTGLARRRAFATVGEHFLKLELYCPNEQLSRVEIIRQLAMQSARPVEASNK